jgi:simple sugar transport system ATP-binding protein
MTGPAVEALGISKSFGSVQALNDVSITAEAGEVTAIIGDNGAGKSTLIKIISGVDRPDSGHVYLYGDRVDFHNPEAARQAGVETVYQTLGLIEDLTIWQNLFLNREVVRGFGPFNMLNKRKMREESLRMLSDLDVHIPSVKARVRGLSGGQRQAVAISRAAGWSSKVVIMDEPTAALGVRETAKVEELIHRLKARGLAVIVISHNFDQVLRLAEQIWVMRQGRLIAGLRAADTRGDELVALITGAAGAPTPKGVS